MKIDKETRDRITKYNINKKIAALTSCKIDKYEFLTDE